MRSPSACSGRAVLTSIASIASIVLAALTTTRSARADDRPVDEKQACSAAYDQTQIQRRAGSFGAARKAAITCVRDVCPEFIRDDCAKWLAEIDASQPSVVLDVHGTNGAPLTGVQVWLDGEPWTDALDGRAKPIDPGNHTVRCVANEAPAAEEKVQILEGEKNRRITVSLATPVVVTEATPIVPLPPVAPVIAPPPASPAPLIIGGVGLAGLVVGAITGALVVHDKSVVNGDCSSASGGVVCREQTGIDATNQGKVLGPVTTVALVTGGLLGGTSIVLFATRGAGARATPPPSVGVRASIAPGGGAWTLAGTF